MPPKGPGRGKLPVPLPKDMILKDTEGKTWRLGSQIGQGGFGLIYLASPQTQAPVEDDAVHVIKVVTNAAVFHIAITLEVSTYSNHKMLRLGAVLELGRLLGDFLICFMCYLCEDCAVLVICFNDSKFNLIIKVILSKDKSIIHLSVHVFQVYLADYGLSYRYCPNGNHKQYQENPRKGHNGTIEFTSIDAHKGVAPSRRGDLEILGYCMLQWLCGKLPWEQNLKDPVAVQTAKTKLMDELPDSVLRWDSPGSSCSEIAKFLASVSGLAYAEKPKYQVLKKILLDGLESSGMRYDGPLEFSAAAACTRNHRTAKVSRVRLPKPPPKPPQQKGKKPEGEEPACQNKVCVGLTGTQLLGEEKPKTRNRRQRQEELQQVRI
ncbi:VRK2 kinase, partial [Oxylabes madagascariensis]|nr:VRK2 kinase [Oxylabes madagascariensis]